MLPPHLMEERLIRQQQEMEEDQRWLEKEERFLVSASRAALLPLSPAGCTVQQKLVPKQGASGHLVQSWQHWGTCFSGLTFRIYFFSRGTGGSGEQPCGFSSAMVFTQKQPP